MRISDCSSDVCSSDLKARPPAASQAASTASAAARLFEKLIATAQPRPASSFAVAAPMPLDAPVTSATRPFRSAFIRLFLPPLSDVASGFRAYRGRSEEHTSELQSLMRNPYAVFCLKKKNIHIKTQIEK